MESITLVGHKAEAAYEAINLVETSLYRGSVLQGMLDNLAGEKKLEIIQGLCSILSIWSYLKYPEEDDSVQKLIDMIREEIEWEADKGRTGLHAKYQALNVLDASTGKDHEFYAELALILEKDGKGISLTGRSKADDNVIRELMNWFRYYSWFGYGRTGPENCQYALEAVKIDIQQLLETGILYGNVE